MNRISSLLQNVFVRVILTTFLVVSTFLLSTFLNYGNSLQAQAKPLTPEATEYQVDQNEQSIPVGDIAENVKDKLGSTVDNVREKLNQNAESAAEGKAQKAGEDVAKTTQNKLENLGDDIREKLNLDQPIYPGTKEFLNDVQDRAEDRVKGLRPEAQDAPRGQRS